jgi:protein-disulfide isomerase
MDGGTPPHHLVSSCQMRPVEDTLDDLAKISRRRAALGAVLLAGTALVAPSLAFAADAAPVYKEFVQGNLKAKVTVIEYASLTCPHCALFMTEGYPQLKKEYIDTGKVKFIYRDFPLDGLATGAALLARCVPGDRGHTMVEMMFQNQNEWIRSEKPLEVLRGYAQLAGLNAAGVDDCLKNQAILKDIQDVQEKAVSLYKVQSTPTFFVGEKQVQGNDYAALKKAIDAQL